MRKGIARLLQGYVSPIVEISIEPLDGIDSLFEDGGLCRRLESM